ncbi:MAG TPA: hypothetical protein PJ982_03995, partial [Lacipirellulaceae bacterium]|nr:hypothetical protein [Lacipirellulaceae bacterium]
MLHLGSLQLPAGFDADGFPASLASLESVEFSITLPADAAAGAYAGTASFSTNDANENPFTFTLSGYEVEPDDHGNNAAESTPIGVPAAEA